MEPEEKGKPKNSKEVISVGIILASFGVLVLFVTLFKQVDIWFPVFVGYIAVCLLFSALSRSFKHPFWTWTSTIVLFPAGIFLYAGVIILPIVTLCFHVIYYFVLALFIPGVVINIVKYFFFIKGLNPATTLYLTITSTVFICVIANSILVKLVLAISPSRIKTSEKMKVYEIDKLTNYLLSRDNIKYTIYFGYVVALIIVNYYNFQGAALSNNIESDKAILQSFATFLAFDRSLNLFKQLDFRPSELVGKTRASILNKIKHLSDENSSKSNSGANS